MRLNGALCTKIRAAAKKVSVGRIGRVELADRIIRTATVPEGGRLPVVTNLMDVEDIDDTELFESMKFGPQNIEESKQFPGCAILECWTYSVGYHGELEDTVYVGIVNNGETIFSHGRFERVREAVKMAAAPER